MKKIISGGTGEFTDKKSRFIANIYQARARYRDFQMMVSRQAQQVSRYWK